MICSNCKKHEAVFHYKQNINGAVSEQHLCAECAKKQGFSVGSVFSGAELPLGGMFSPFGDALGALMGGAPAVAQERCPMCGSSFDELRQSGKIGCEKCYDYFSKYLLPSIAKVQGNTVHRGKKPHGQTRSGEIAALKKELNEAIASENYERAAELRDRIAELGKRGGKDE